MKYRSSTRFILEGLEGVAVTLAVLLTWPVSRLWLQNWGAVVEEKQRQLPGDKLVLPQHSAYTRAVTIDAPPSAVWPWLVQFGFGRAGFYSYELLERLVGIPVKNVESIVPECQGLTVGDSIVLHPKVPGIPVAALKGESHICLGVDADVEHPQEKPDPGRSWSMYIEPASGNSTRLILRGCIEPLRESSLSGHLAIMIEAPIDFIMEQRMLRTIKRLAESDGRHPA